MNIHDKIVEIICAIIGALPDQVNDSHSLHELDMDEIDRLELRLEIEDEFDISIEDGIITKESTVADIAYMVGSKL